MELPVRFAAPDPQRQSRGRVSFGDTGADHSAAGFQPFLGRTPPLSNPTNNGTVADGVHETGLTHAEAKQRADFRADGEVLPVGRKHRRFHATPCAPER